MYETSGTAGNSTNDEKLTQGALFRKNDSNKAHNGPESDRADKNSAGQPSNNYHNNNAGPGGGQNAIDSMDIENNSSQGGSRPTEDVEMEDVESVRKDAGGNGASGNNSTTSGETMKNGENSQNGVVASGSGEKKGSKNNSQKGAKTNGSAAAPAENPALPVMRGTLFYEDRDKGRRHVIRGMWNFENSNSESQRFDLFRTLDDHEELEKLPTDGVFSGSFSLAWQTISKKGKKKSGSKVITESGVKIKFAKTNVENEYTMSGTGTNQFGVFHISGTAKPSHHDGDKVFDIEFRKSYELAPQAAAEPAPSKKKKSGSSVSRGESSGPLPPPSATPASGVYCLRGKLAKHPSSDLGMSEVVHRVRGTWASGLDLILADPEGTGGRVSKFEYEHKSMVPTHDFPVSGKYSGWFDLRADDGSTQRIKERDVTLNFLKNNEGFFNVEGKGSNGFGRYSITGTLAKDDTLTLFRHFQIRKSKSSSKSPTDAPPPINAPQARRSSVVEPAKELTLKLEDVKTPSETGKDLKPIKAPSNQTYSAASQGTMRIDKEGSHSCQGKWAVTREHLTNESLTSPFSFMLDPLHAQEATPGDSTEPQFPLDSAMYKGSFNLKKQAGARQQSQRIVDQQIVMKFRKNSEGFYNVYGKGVNDIGTFTLVGNLIVTSKTAGRVELYRTYPPNLLKKTSPIGLGGKQAPTTASHASDSGTSLLPGPPPSGVTRRESTRLVKLPSKLEDDNPSAQLNRAMVQCAQLLKTIQQEDARGGGIFAEPVDPVKLGIPTYLQVIKEPMDLKTIATKMEAHQVTSPEEFSRLVRLVFENAMQFNVDPAHGVHRAARGLLTLFTKKYRDIDRLVKQVRKSQGDEDKGKKKKGKKVPEKPKTPREIRLEEAQTMANENARAMADIRAAATPGSQAVSQNEFSLLLRALERMQQQMVHTHTLLAGLFPGDDASATSVPSAVAPILPMSAPAPAPAPVERKKPAPKRKSEALKPEPIVIPDDSTPLTITEQTLLTNTINELDQEHLGGVIQIIREAAPVGADEDEIDLEIDQLDTKTQRKLLSHVQKFVKKPQSKAKKQRTTGANSKKSKAQPTPKVEQPPPAPAPAPAPAPKSKQPTTDALFSFGKDDDSDSDSDDEEPPEPKNATKSAPNGGKQFKLDSLDDEDDDDDDNEFGFGSGTTSWNISKSENENTKKEGDDDDAWGAAREAAAVGKVRDAERKAREKKIELEAENAKNQRLADAAARGEEIKAQRAEEEAKEAELREKKEKEKEEERQAAREAARAQVQSVEQTVDLDAQRDIMKQYEQSYSGGEYGGGASPSSDFGF